MLNNDPEVTLIFWIIKIMATTVGETAGVDAKGAQTRIVVETNGPKGIQTIMVDAQNGQVVGSHAGGEID